MIIKGIIFVIAAYLLGSVPVGFLLCGVVFKKDIRKVGSGNIGATNIYRSLGPVAGLGVFIFDFLKGALPVLLFTIFSKDMPTAYFQFFQVAVAFAAIAGHVYSIFLNFSGGKGVATAAGVLLVISWKVTLVLFLIWITLLLVFRYVSLASVTIAVALPFLAFMLERGNTAFFVFGIVAAVLVVYKHLGNLQRIMKGKEPKILEKA